METKYEWNRSMQRLVRRSVKGFEEQASRPLESISVARKGSTENDGEEDDDSSAMVPWMKRLTKETGVKPQTASTIISQLNSYHRKSSIDSKGDPKRTKFKVTPPSVALKAPWEGQHKQTDNDVLSGHPKDPSPLMLPVSKTSLTSPSGRSPNTPKQTLSLTPKKGVPHIYHDYSNVPDIVGVVRKKTGGVTQPFPEKLHVMLDSDDDPSVVGWLPHGRAFLVRKPAEFTNEIMPKYFRQTKLTSFQRQLNLYGFRRLTQGVDSGAYYHELFLRGRPQLCLRMQRQKIKGTGHKQPADVQTEPNFYNMVSSQKSSTLTRSDQFPVSASAPLVTNEPREAPYKSPTLAELSPKSRGAANLLTDMLMKSSNSNMRGRPLLDSNFSLGQSAVSSTQQSHRTLSPSSSLSHSSHPGSSPTPSISNDLYVTNQRSMSLLGRVQHFQKPLRMKPTSSRIINPSFFGPPRKNAINSPTHTAVTFESSSTSSPSPTDPYLQTEIERKTKPFTIDQRQRNRKRSESSLSVSIGVTEKRNVGLY